MPSRPHFLPYHAYCYCITFVLVYCIHLFMWLTTSHRFHFPFSNVLVLAMILFSVSINRDTDTFFKFSFCSQVISCAISAVWSIHRDIFLLICFLDFMIVVFLFVVVAVTGCCFRLHVLLIFNFAEIFLQLLALHNSFP